MAITYKDVDGRLEITDTVEQKSAFSRVDLEGEKKMEQDNIVRANTRIAEIDKFLTECTKLSI